jgi:hypothetical protein
MLELIEASAQQSKGRLFTNYSAGVTTLLIAPL